MSMNPREKRLAIIVGAIFVCFVGYLALAGGVDPFADLRNERDGLVAAIDKAEKEAGNLRKAEERVKVWQKRSLPSDLEVAGSRYNQWLRDLVVDKVHFRSAKVEPSQAAQPRRGVYIVHHYAVTGQASLTQLTQFLQEFYATGYLHQLKVLKINPAEKTGDLGLTIAVEALSVEDAVAKADLPKDLITPPIFKDPKAYKIIPERNLFKAFAEVKPKIDIPPVQPVIFNASKYTRVTGIVEVDGKPQVWLRSLVDDKKFILSSGETFTVDRFKATVARIGRREIEVEVDGKRHVIPLGESVISDAPPPLSSSLDPQRKPEPTPDAKPEAKPEEKSVKGPGRTELGGNDSSNGKSDSRGKMDFRGKRNKRDRKDQDKG